MLGPLPQRRGEERRQNPSQRTERGGIGAAGHLAHQIGLVAELHRQRQQRARRKVDILVRGVTAETAQEVVFGNAELRVFTKLFAQMFGRSIEEMRRPLGKILGSTQRAPTSAQ